MCGIAGVVSFEERLAPDEGLLRRMCACIAHRGPDGEGIEIVRAGGAVAGLCHRRLAVLDPDPRSNQPYFLEHQGRRIWLTFNGEIYNFRELREELEKLLTGHAWQTTGDTEMLAAAYLAWGEGCVERLLGMFAFVVFEEGYSELFVARDRMGQKPLFVAVGQGGAGTGTAAVAFASELGAVAAVPWVNRAVSDDALLQYLAHGYIPGPQTIYEGVWKVEPGTTVRFRADREPDVRMYYNRAQNQPHGSACYGGDPGKLITEAVRSQLVSDVPLGCFLSGGIDSSVIALCGQDAMRQSGTRLKTFTVRFDDQRYDESEFAAEVARHLGTDHQTLAITPDAAADLPGLAASFGEPFGDSSCLPTYYLSRETRKHVKVALSGDGGDELFGGYERYRAMHLAEWIPMAETISAFIDAPALARRHPKSRLARLGRFLTYAALPPPLRYEGYMRLFPPGLLGAPRLTGSVGAVAFPQTRRRDVTVNAAGDVASDVVAAAAAFDRLTYLEGDLLTKTDRASMRVGLEVRCPFMDHRVVNMASGLSCKQLIGGGPKALLRRHFAGRLPKSVFARKKMGFAIPIGEWFRTSLRSLPHDLLLAADSFSAQRFGHRELRTLVEDHESGYQDHSQRLFALVMLELWARARPKAS